MSTNMNIMLPRLKWNESYSVGVPIFDADEKRVFSYMNLLCDSMMGRRDSKATKKTLKSLFGFLISHFVKEETALYKYGYPQFIEHRAEHLRYLNDIWDINVRYQAGEGDSKIMCAELLGVVTELLQEHIQKVDKLYGPFLAAKGVERAAL